MSFKVAKKCCSECLFTTNKIVSHGTKSEVLQDCLRKDAHFVCHKATIKGQDICCRGFYDQDPGSTNMMRIASRLGEIRFVDVD